LTEKLGFVVAPAVDGMSNLIEDKRPLDLYLPELSRQHHALFSAPTTASRIPLYPGNADSFVKRINLTNNRRVKIGRQTNALSPLRTMVISTPRA